MAHNTGWSKFAENFNSMYDVTSGAFQKYDINKIMKEKPQVISKGLGPGPHSVYQETYGGDTYNKPITDEQLRGLQNTQIADVYTRYGDVDKAMNMRMNQAKIRESTLAGNLAAGTLDAKIKKEELK